MLASVFLIASALFMGHGLSGLFVDGLGGGNPETFAIGLVMAVMTVRELLAQAAFEADINNNEEN